MQDVNLRYCRHKSAAKISNMRLSYMSLQKCHKAQLSYTLGAISVRLFVPEVEHTI